MNEITCVNCQQPIHIMHPTGSGWVWGHDSHGTWHCIADGALTAAVATPGPTVVPAE